MRATIVVFSIFLNRLDGVFYIHQYSSLQRLEFGSSNSTAWTTFDTWLFHQSDLHWRICLKVGSRVKQLCTFKTNVDQLMFSYNFSSIITVMNAGKISICSHHLSILLTLFLFFTFWNKFIYLLNLLRVFEDTFVAFITWNIFKYKGETLRIVHN